MKSVTIRDFSGGLDTATDPSRLPSNKSPDLENVEILDSRAIRRRKGFAPITNTPLRDDKVESVSRVYLANDSSYWFSRCGTAAFSAPDNVTTSYGLVQVETLASSPSDVSGLVYANTGYSGGSAVRLTSTSIEYEFAIPYSSRAVFSIGGDGVSYSVDGSSAWVNATGTTLTAYSGVTASPHTVTFKGYTTRQLKSLKLAPSGNLKYRQRTKTVALGGVSPTYDWYALYFYDDGVSTNKDIIVRVDHGANSFQWGVYRDKSTTHYCYNRDSGGWVIGDTMRSSGWHVIYFRANQFTAGSYFMHGIGDVDSTDFSRTSNFSSNLSASSFTVTCYVRCRDSAGSTVTAYFDELKRQEDVPLGSAPTNLTTIDDFNSLTGWTGAGTATDNDAISTEQYRGGVESFIDTCEYQHSATQSRVVGLSASTSDLAIATLNGKVYFADAYKNIREWNGTAATSVASSGTAPPARFLVTHKRRLFAAGKASDRDLLEYTAVDSGRNWSDGGSIRVFGKDSGADCTGLIVWGNILWYFSYSRLHALDITGPETNWVNKTVNDRYGCIAPRTLVSSPNALIFLSEGGVRAHGTIPGVNTDDGSGFLWLSEAIQPTLDTINQAHLDKCVGAFYRNKYYLSVPLGDATENSDTFVFRFAEGNQPAAWTRYSYGVDCFHTPRGDEEGLYGGNSQNGHIYRFEYGSNDAGAPISVYYKTPPLAPDGYQTIKHFRRAYFVIDATAPQTMLVTPYTDDESGEPVTLSISDSTDVQPVRTPLNARGRSLGLIFEGQGDDQDVTLSEVTLTYVEPRLR